MGGIELKEEAVNGKDDIRGQRHSGEARLEIWGKEAFFWRLGTIFSGLYFSGLKFGLNFIGEHRLLGVLGSGAKNPYRILELGSRIGSVPS